MNNRNISIFAACAAILAGPVPSLAEESDWEFRVSPYLWAPSLGISAAIGGSPSAESDTNLLDILNFAFLVNGEARKGRFAIIGEFNYLSVSDDASWGPGGNGHAEATISGVMAGAALSYRVIEEERFSLDPFAGFRLWALNTEVDFDRLPTVSDDTTLLGPIIGIRGNFSLSERWSLHGLAEIGGFDVGTKFQWEAAAEARYRFGETTAIGFGYRYLSLEMENSSAVTDASLGGPFIAVDIHF